MSTPQKDPLSQAETTCGSLLYELQIIWDEVGEAEPDRDRMLFELEQECLEVYRRKVDQANRSRATLRQAIADCEAELAAICSAMGERPVHIRQSDQNAGSLKEEHARILPYLEEMKKQKFERRNQFMEVQEQIQNISIEIYGPKEYVPTIVDETDLSLRKLEELHRQLNALQSEKSDRLKKVQEHLYTLNSLCSVLGFDFMQTVLGIHPSLGDIEGPTSVSNDTIQQLAVATQQLREIKLQRMQKLQDLATTMLELWNLMDTPIEEQQMFQNVTCNIAASEDEITEPNTLSADFINCVEVEVSRLEELKSSKMKELVLKKRTELEEICRKTHLVPETDGAIEYAVEAIESGAVDPACVLEQFERQVAQVKEEALGRKDILEKVEKWLAACDEESWLEEYNRDDNRYNAGRGAHLTLKRAEKARGLVNKIPAMVDVLTSKTIAWEKERGVEFTYDGIRLLSMIELKLPPPPISIDTLSLSLSLSLCDGCYFSLIANMSSITSVELNYLVFRYLQESGFTHSAFVFGNEGGINKCPIDGNLVPPGALVTFVQKGMQFLEMEANLNNCDADYDEDFSFLQPLDLITKDVHELKKMINERRRKLQKGKNKESEKEHEGDRGRVREKERHEKEKESEKDKDKIENHKEQELHNENQISRDMVLDQEDKVNGAKKEDKVNGAKKEDKANVAKKEEKVNSIKKEDKVNVKLDENGAFGGPEPMDICTTSTSHPIEFPKSDVTILEGHTSEVCACAWSPTGSLLASGSGDSTARIWTVAEGTSKLDSMDDPLNVLVLQHIRGTTNEKSKDVTTLDWNGEGTLLATGSYDGQARIWTTNGELKSTLSKHKGPIFSLKWNKKGDYILTGSCDETAIVWDVQAEKWKQQFEFHAGPVLDADWRNNVSFATSSTDTTIHVCKIGENQPIKTFAGHQSEVNCIKWDPTGSLLASCSDDSTAKIWSMKQDKYIHDFREHSKEIYTIRWSPTGPGTNNPNKKLVLASASFDSTVKIWDVELGKLIYSLNGHRDGVYSVAFSPNGEYLASGSPDKSIHIWSLNDGKIIKTYNGNGGIFEVCWNKEGDQIAGCFANNTVCILDFRM